MENVPERSPKRVAVSVCLGELELSLSDFLRLAQGTSLQFEVGAALEAVLKLGDEEVARGDLTVGEKGATLLVREGVRGCIPVPS